MTTPELLTVAALVLSLANFIVLLLSFRRLGQWKDSEDAKKLIDRVAACESTAGSTAGLAVRTENALAALTGRVSGTEGDVSGLKVRMENVATKADISRLTSEVAAVERHAKSIEGGVERIEGYLMNNSRGSA